MDDGDLLLKAILAAPGEDTPRLMYADWLDERGEPDRAEFIRVQVELARLPAYHAIHGHVVEFSAKPEPVRVTALVNRDDLRLQTDCALRHRNRDDSYYDISGLRVIKEEEFDHARLRVTFFQVGERDDFAPRRYQLIDRERVLLTRDVPHPGGAKWSQWEAWLPDGFDRVTSPTGATWFRRGFVESVTCSAAVWLTHADAILAAHPVTAVALTTAPEIEARERNDKSSLLDARLVGRRTVLTFDWMRPGAVYDWVLQLLSAEWPGVTFTLPNEPT